MTNDDKLHKCKAIIEKLIIFAPPDAPIKKEAKNLMGKINPKTYYDTDKPWYEKPIPDHGVLCWIGSDIEDLMGKYRMTRITRVTTCRDSPSGFLFEISKGVGNAYAHPLTNEEIEAFKR